MAASIGSRVSRETVTLAVSALVKWMQAQAKKKKAQLLDTDDLLHLLITLKRIPSTSKTNPIRIPLPHSLHSLPSTSICIFLSDHTAVTSLPSASVIPLSSLRTDYRAYEARRKLCDSHHLFFADRSILPLLPRLLGKTFFKKKKIPLAIDFSRQDWGKQIQMACSSTLLYLRTGASSGLKVGRVMQDVEQIVDNVVAAVEGAVAHIPRKWANVRSFHVKSVDSLALPIYQAVPDIGLKIRSFPKEEALDGEVIQMESKKRGRGQDEESDELATSFIGDSENAVEGGDTEVKRGMSKKSKVGTEKTAAESSKKKKRGRVTGTVIDDGVGVVAKESVENVVLDDDTKMKKCKKSKLGVEKKGKKKDKSNEKSVKKVKRSLVRQCC